MDNVGSFKPSREHLITDLKSQLPFIQIYPSVISLEKASIRFYICCKLDCDVPKKVGLSLVSSDKQIFQGSVELHRSKNGNKQTDRCYYQTKEITIPEEYLVFLCNNVAGAQLEFSDGERQSLFHFHM